MDNNPVPVGFMLLFVCTGLLLVGLSIPLPNPHSQIFVSRGGTSC